MRRGRESSGEFPLLSNLMAGFQPSNLSAHGTHTVHLIHRTHHSEIAGSNLEDELRILMNPRNIDLFHPSRPF